VNLIVVGLGIALVVTVAVSALALAGLQWRLVAGIATISIAFTYLAALLAVGIWASQCWRCQQPTGSDSRETSFRIAVVYYGAAATVLIATTLFASWGASLVRSNRGA
jgi:hypothetical protein